MSVNGKGVTMSIVMTVVFVLLLVAVSILPASLGRLIAQASYVVGVIGAATVALWGEKVLNVFTDRMNKL